MIISIDPAYAKPIAFAVWSVKKKLLLTGKAAETIELKDFISRAEKIYIEDQYFQNNPKVLKLLSRCVGEIIGICKMLGIDYELVSPATWQSRAGLIYGEKPEHLTTHYWKLDKINHLKAYASLIVDSEVEDEDIAAAVLIGYSIGVEDESKN